MTTETHKRIPAINQVWPEQGGIYIGSRLIQGTEHHIVIAGGVDHDAKAVAFDKVQESIPAEINGHSDWRAPDKEDLMLAYINAREHFVAEEVDSIYWSRTIDGGNWPWAVDFENGGTGSLTRSHEFRVRPFRSFPAAAL